MAKTILIKPLLTEKSELLSENQNQFSFIVNRKANKIEIKKAVEKMYNVNVASVNTLTQIGKSKNRNSRSGLVRGNTSTYKKAIVTLTDGETIDFFGDI
ncbi:MAG TPA: 50S ribosomal protein L23 [Phaeodactylibacter sp.]|nr:50S ribosomal protein L23 [Phaeodactylibacter sp.]